MHPFIQSAVRHIRINLHNKDKEIGIESIRLVEATFNWSIHSRRPWVNEQLEKELQNFKGLVTKISTNKIQVIFRGDDADMDTMVVDLRKTTRKN